MKLPELLAPAGNLDRLHTAYAFGADAVYLAGQRFSLRKHADNCSLDEIRSATAIARKMGKKIYITMNILAHECDMAALPEWLAHMEDIQPDALIIADAGIFAAARKQTTIPLHISTQASVLNSRSSQFWIDQGASRIILGREVSIAECAHLFETTGIDIEIFVHGSMCASHSGKCVISSYTAGRDSNRGGCMHSCRYQFGIENNEQEIIQQTPLMNAQDLMGISLLPDIQQAGIASLKVEGRMKNDLYLANTLSCYRAALDALATKESAPIHQLEEQLHTVSNRTLGAGFLQERSTGVNTAFEGYQAQIKFLGKVRHSTAGTIVVEWKDGAVPGDAIRILTPDGNYHDSTLPAITNLHGETVERSRPNSIGFLKLDIPQGSVIARHLLEESA